MDYLKEGKYYLRCGYSERPWRQDDPVQSVHARGEDSVVTISITYLGSAVNNNGGRHLMISLACVVMGNESVLKP